MANLWRTNPWQSSNSSLGSRHSSNARQQSSNGRQQSSNLSNARQQSDSSSNGRQQSSNSSNARQQSSNSSNARHQSSNSLLNARHQSSNLSNARQQSHSSSNARQQASNSSSNLWQSSNSTGNPWQQGSNSLLNWNAMEFLPGDARTAFSILTLANLVAQSSSNPWQPSSNPSFYPRDSPRSSSNPYQSSNSSSDWHATEFHPAAARDNRPLCVAWTKGECDNFCRGLRHYYVDSDQQSVQQGWSTNQRKRMCTSDFSSPYKVRIDREIKKRRRIEVDLETGEDFSFDETVVNDVIDLTGNSSSGQRVRKVDDVSQQWSPNHHRRRAKTIDLSP